MIALAGGCAFGRHWSKTDTALELAVATSIAVDAWQSSPVLHDCAETNPVLGPCGDRVPAAVYFPIAAIAHAVVAAALPPAARAGWQCLVVGLELHQIWTTYELGWR